MDKQPSRSSMFKEFRKRQEVEKTVGATNSRPQTKRVGDKPFTGMKNKEKGEER